MTYFQTPPPGSVFPVLPRFPNDEHFSEWEFRRAMSNGRTYPRTAKDRRIALGLVLGVFIGGILGYIINQILAMCLGIFAGAFIGTLAGTYTALFRRRVRNLAK
jgi:hypothetical protein